MNFQTRSYADLAGASILILCLQWFAHWLTRVGHRGRKVHRSDGASPTRASPFHMGFADQSKRCSILKRARTAVLDLDCLALVWSPDVNMD
jgi:hypothetical protein